MKVELIVCTPDALTLLLGTKSTRMRGQDPATMTEAERHAHFAYMLDTIKSPFEFVDYVFRISGVSKNFTHQLVRTRTGAYQQETSRALEVSAVVRPEAFEWPENDGDYSDDKVEGSILARLWDDAIADAQANYQQLLTAGAQLQDARAIVPSNMETTIEAKFNLRTLSDMAKNRLCARTQGEYQNVFRAMRKLVLDIHPWADPLIQVACVATGTCAFPRWGSKVIDNPVVNLFSVGEKVYQCPHYDPRMDLDALKEEVRVKFWSRAELAQANPVAKNGVSM